MIPRQSRTGTAVSEGAEATLVPTFGVFCLLLFCFVMFSQKLPLGEVAAGGAILAAVFRQGRFEIPAFFRWYLLYVIIGLAGLMSTRYRAVVSDAWIEVAKFAVIGLAACNIIATPRSSRAFAFGYLALFALFPVRGALYNYINGYTEAGRVAWNFFFGNPNDLAMTCFLPLGLCAYLIYLDRGTWVIRAAWVGLVVLTGVQMLTQSRGAILALGVGLLYFIFYTRRRTRTLLIIGALCAIAVVGTPRGVWDRVSGLSKLPSGDVSQVDPEGSASGRLTLMRIAAGIAREHPFLGVGLGAYSYENERVTEGDLSVGLDERRKRDAHSTYLRAAAETGWFGGLCVIASVVGAIYSCRSARRKISTRPDGRRQAMAILALEASMIAYAAGALVNSGERSTYFMLQFVIPWALTAVLLRAHGSEPAPTERSANPAHRRRAAGAVAQSSRG
jgi:O-antigen ligase